MVISKYPRNSSGRGITEAPFVNLSVKDNSDLAIIQVSFIKSHLSKWWFIGRDNSKETHDGVIKWKHFPRYWPFVRGIHRSTVNSPLKGQWRGALMFSLICARINGWVNNREAGDLRRHCTHYDVNVMTWKDPKWCRKLKLNFNCGNISIMSKFHGQVSTNSPQNIYVYYKTLICGSSWVSLQPHG